MLVYGDPRFEERLRVLAGSLREQTEKAQDLEEFRQLVIQAGQLEQGVFDQFPQPSGPEQQVLAQASEVTDLAAQAFYQTWAKAAGIASPPGNNLQELLRKAAQTLAEIKANPVLTIKIPEGFQFYALYPEQYCASAWRWAREHAGTWPKRAIVVGIRSIGTSLSAVVKAALQAEGWLAERVTVRPGGHPFHRTVDLGCAGRRSVCRSALVVDEGPGLSGSSMAAVAQALAEAGAEDISFFPGHAGEPGNAASAEVRHWWAKAPRYLTGLEDLRWDGLSLPESLSLKNHQWPRSNDGMIRGASRLTPHASRVTDLSAGLWRQHAFAAEQEWPAVCGSFERMKFKCLDANGGSVLWKFAGLGCAARGGANAAGVEALTRLAAESWTPKPLGTWRGFLAVPWIEGLRLTARQGTERAVLKRLGKYLARVAGAPLSPAAARSAVARLAEMLYWNTREALGEELAERSRSWTQFARELAPGPSYGDGRMGPWEWVQTPAGQLLKTDCTGHALDHTVVGGQSVLWDVAGTLVEWGLEAEGATPLLCPLRETGVEIKREALRFYESAYAAFRMGMTSLGASQLAEGAPERERLLRATDYYRWRLELGIGS